MNAPRPALKGLFVDLVAPCGDDGRFLSREFHVHLRRMARVRDVQGVVVNGPAGEGCRLDREMRMKVLEAGISAAPEGFPVFAVIPADPDRAASEAREAVNAGAAGVVLRATAPGHEANASVQRALGAVPGHPVLAWCAGSEMPEQAGGLAAIIVDHAAGSLPGGAPAVLIADRGFEPGLVADGRVDGAVLACANLAEALWGRFFRFAQGDRAEAEAIFGDRLRPWHRVIVDIAASAPEAEAAAAAAIKHGLCTMTQNSSAATFPPLVDIGDPARDAVVGALRAGRLLPGMV